jgi:diguanylate cyclase (GGDEF)-like protein
MRQQKLVGGDVNSWKQSLRDLTAKTPDHPELALAQFKAFSKQIPLLYFILLVNAWTVSITHISVAPVALAVYAPGLLSILCLVRLVRWIRNGATEPSTDQARAALKSTTRLAALLAVAFAAWALAIHPYGDAYQQSQVAFFLAITVVGCVFCLMHVRAAALMVAALINIPFVAFFGLSGNPTFIGVTVNMALVSLAMAVIVLIYYRDFTELIMSRRTLEAKQAETKALSDENFRLANLDSLTDLPNRRSYFSSLDEQIVVARERGWRLAVGVLDLDGFKPVNDTHGHPVGDKLLKLVADRLREACGTGMEPYRLGGDEFGLLLQGDLDDAALLGSAEFICNALKAPFELTGVTVRISCTVGLAVYPDMSADAVELFERADYALYHAKRNGKRGGVTLFSAEHEADIRRHSLVEQALRSGDLEREMSLAYQPIVDATTGKPIGFEALARWTSPEIGVVRPDEFISVAEKSGLIPTLTRLLLGKALQAVKGWPEPLRLSFNLSVHDLAASDGVLRILAMIGQSGVSPSRIELEITETAMVHDFAQVTTAIDTLKAFGVGISLDDFGTGYSSLRQVHRLPLDKLKIDRSFITDIHLNTVSHKIVKSLVTLCRDMNLKCVVEGVEREEELAVLRELGCELIQGYYYAKPMQQAEIDGYLLALAPTPERQIAV